MKLQYISQLYNQSSLLLQLKRKMTPYTFTCTTGDVVSFASANRMLMEVLRCWPDPIPPTYRCKQPSASEWPVRLTASRALFSLSKLFCAISATNLGSPTTWAMRPMASPDAHLSVELGCVKPP